VYFLDVYAGTADLFVYFADADTFPCILTLQKPKNQEDLEGDKTSICIFPREELDKTDITPFIFNNSYHISSERFDNGPWSLERSEVNTLMHKISQAGVPLISFTGSKPYRGILTGFNEAFLIDTATRNLLVQDNPNAAAIIKPFLRGQDIKRWSPQWADLWMILLKSSDNYAWPWSDAGEQAEAIFAATYPSIYSFFAPFKEQMMKRWDKGRYWWELRSCAYYEQFEKPKIIYQEIQFHPAYSYDTENFFMNNKVFLLPVDDLYLFAVLNSPLMWWHNWRYLPHMKDEALKS
jgi:hypothetical protein